MTWGVACIHGCSRKNPNTPETLESFTFANLAERRSGKAAKCSCADFSIFEGNPVAASRTDFAKHPKLIKKEDDSIRAEQSTR